MYIAVLQVEVLAVPASSAYFRSDLVRCSVLCADTVTRDRLYAHDSCHAH